MELAADIQGRAESSRPVSLANAAKLISGFLDRAQFSLTDPTIQRYHHSVAQDLQDSAQAQRDRYESQRIVTSQHFRATRKSRKAFKKRAAAAAPDELPLPKNELQPEHHQQEPPPNANPDTETPSKRKKKKRKLAQQDS